jgi:hypothetical protein
MHTKRWSYRDPTLLWLLACAFMLHIVEEWVAGFPTWIARILAASMPVEAFFIINGGALLLMMIGIRAATRHESRGWIAVAIATIALVNTASHVGASIFSGGYAPGLITAVVFYVPLGGLTLLRAIDQAPRTQIVRGIVAGLLLHAALLPIVLAVVR